MLASIEPQTLHTALLLLFYCALCFVAALAGGWIPLLMRLTHRRMQIAISFVSGVILGIGLLHLLPHSFIVLGSIDTTMLWVLTGFLFMFFLERFFQFHHHDVEDDAAESAGHEAPAPAHHHHDHAHDAHNHAHHDHSTGAASTMAWGGATIGLSLHGLVDGIALAAAVQAESAHHGAHLAGIGTALAIMLHKPFDSLTVGTLMAAGGKSQLMRRWINVLYALVTPLGVLFCFALASSVPALEAYLGEALAFSAGAFVCIATSDLLPELHFHRHDRVGLSLALVAGIGLAWATGFLETDGHEHPQPAAQEKHSHPHD